MYCCVLQVATLEKQIENHRLASLKTKFTDFFSVDWHNMLAIFKIGPSTCSGSEAAECLNNRRISKDVYKRSRYYIILILLAMFFFTFQREEKSYMFLYTKSKFHWQEQNFSIFRVIRSSCYAFSLMVLLPVLTKLFKFGDFTISYAGCMAHIISHLGFYFAESEVIFLMCAILGSLGVVVGPLIRSMASKIVVETQRGKMFALLSVCDNAVPFISTFAYSNIYRYTLGTSHSGVFILTVVTQMTVLTLLSTILILNRSQILKPPTEQMNLLQCSDSFWISGTGSDGASQANTASATTTINTNTLPQANAIHMNTLKRKHNTSSRTEKNTRNASPHPVNEIKANILEAIMVM